jgi:hypothetical protein
VSRFARQEVGLAPASITRLIDDGSEPLLLASEPRGLIHGLPAPSLRCRHQNLGRHVAPNAKTFYGMFENVATILPCVANAGAGAGDVQGPT